MKVISSPLESYITITYILQNVLKCEKTGFSKTIAYLIICDSCFYYLYYFVNACCLFLWLQVEGAVAIGAYGQ